MRLFEVIDDETEDQMFMVLEYVSGGTLYQQAPLRKGTYTSLPQTSREMASSGSEAKRDCSEV